MKQVLLIFLSAFSFFSCNGSTSPNVSSADTPAAGVSSGGVELSWRGEWDPVADYKANDVVSYGGGSYVCLSENRGIPPDINSQEWMIFAKSGEQGDAYVLSTASWVSTGEELRTAAENASIDGKVKMLLLEPGRFELGSQRLTIPGNLSLMGMGNQQSVLRGELAVSGAVSLNNLSIELGSGGKVALSVENANEGLKLSNLKITGYNPEGEITGISIRSGAGAATVLENITLNLSSDSTTGLNVHGSLLRIRDLRLDLQSAQSGFAIWADSSDLEVERAQVTVDSDDGQVTGVFLHRVRAEFRASTLSVSGDSSTGIRAEYSIFSWLRGEIDAGGTVFEKDLFSKLSFVLSGLTGSTDTASCVQCWNDSYQNLNDQCQP